MKLEPIPQHLIEEFIARHKPAAKVQPRAAPSNGYDAPSVEEIEDALSHLPAHFGPNSYDVWLKVLMAVHAALPGPEGAALCERYIPGYDGEIASKWSGFEQGNGVSAASLFHVAGQYGWRPRRESSAVAQEATEELALDEIVAVVEGRAGTALPFALYAYRAEDGGVLDAWRDHYADVWLYVTGYERWYSWRRTHWEQDLARGLERELTDLLSAMNAEAESRLHQAWENDDEAGVKKARAYSMATRRTQGRINSVMAMARGYQAAPGASINQGNNLNLINGVFDLEAFVFREHRREDLFTYVLPYGYDPEARSQLWEEVFIRNVLVDEDGEYDPALALLFQELMGYSLTTDTSYEVMCWLYGDGGNGKTVAVEVLKAMLGHMAIDVDFATLGLPGNYDLAKLPGARVAFSTESERGSSVSEGYVKRIASGETIGARPIYGSPFEFKSTAKIWWAMNDKPIIKSTSNSLWRRLKLIPFNRTFTDGERDPQLLRKLLGQLPGILNWALEGLHRLHRTRAFTHSTQADAVLQEYVSESNPVGLWREERTLPASEPATSARVLYEDYKDWCRDSGRQAMNETNFGRELKRLRVAWKRSDGTKYALYLNQDTDIGKTLGL